LNEIKYFIASNLTPSESKSIGELRYNIFSKELNLLSENKNEIYLDAWDQFSTHIFAKRGNNIIGSGRIIHFNDKFGFRVSSTIDLNNYFKYLKDIVEISGLCVSKSERNKGIGTSIQYLRINYALRTKINKIIATTFHNNKIYFIKFGFKVLIDNIIYKNYESSKSSILLYYDSDDKISINKFDKYFSNKLDIDFLLKNIIVKT